MGLNQYHMILLLNYFLLKFQQAVVIQTKTYQDQALASVQAWAALRALPALRH